MKTATKVLSLVIALALVFTTCSFSVMAENSALIIDDVTGSQVATAIINDLSLPAGYTWTSSDEDIISIGEEANGAIPATVTRALLEDKEVTLTADDGTNTQNFDLVVKAKTTNVIAAGTSDGGNHDVLTAYTDFNGNKTEDNLTIKQDDDGNWYQYYNYTAAEPYDMYGLTAEQLRAVKSAGKVVVEFDFNYEQTTKDQPIDLRIQTNSVSHRLVRLNNGKVLAGNSTSGVEAATGSWHHIAIKLDVYTGMVSVTLGGNTVSNQTCYNATTYSAQDYLDQVLSDKGITALCFIKGSQRSDCGIFSLDNFCIYGEDPSNMNEADQKAYIEGLSWSDFSTEDASAVTNLSNIFSTANGLIEWSSSDSAITFENFGYTSSDGTVTVTKEHAATVARSDGKFNKNVIITATNKNGAEYGVKKFNVSVLPTGYGTDFSTDSNTLSTILEDFEGGVEGEDVEYYSDTTYTTTGVSTWAFSDAFATPVFKYVLDEEKGFVGKLSGVTTDKYANAMHLKSGNYPDKHTSATLGIDVKFSEGETADSMAKIQLACAVEIINIFIKNGKVGLYNGKTTSWYDVDTSNWIRIDVDANLISRTNDIYVNDVKLNSVPFPSTAYYTYTGVSSQIRWAKFYTLGTSELLLDNISVTCRENADASKAEAAINAAYTFYNGTTVTDEITLAANGPVYNNVTDFREGIDAIDANTKMTGGATIVWAENGEVATALNPTSPTKHTYTLTAKSGEETATGNVTIIGTPVVITVENDGDVKLSGNTEGGALVVATMDGDKLSAVKVYTSFDGINVADIASYKLIFIDSLGNLAPKAFAISK